MSKDVKNVNSYADRWVYKAKKITVARGVGYGLTDLMGGGWNTIVSGVIFAYLMAQGFDPAIAGAVTGAGRVVDCVFSLFFGAVTDGFYRNKFGKKYGRRHFFIFAGLCLFIPVFLMFWIPVDSYWYYLVVYSLVEIAIAMILIPWETLPTEMTTDYSKRTVLSGSRMFISAAGTSIVFIVLAVLKNLNDSNAFLITGIIYTVVFAVGIFISWRATWEKVLSQDIIDELNNRPKLNVLQFLGKTFSDYASTFKNKSFRKHLTVYLLSFTGKDFYATLFPTFVVYACMGNDGDPWTYQALAFVGIFATLLAAKLMIAKGPRFLFALSYSAILLSLVGYVAVYFLHISNPFWIFIVISIVYQCGRAILEFTPWNVFPFIPDVDRIMTRGDRAGIYAAVMTFFRKSTGAIAAWVAGIILSDIGFTAAPKGSKADEIHAYAQALPQNITDGITWTFFLIPGILILLALIVSHSFRLNKETHGVLKAEIERLEAGGSKSEVTDEARKVTEALSGHKYETLWPSVPLL
jgi:oligogalacturonide transporter